MLLFVHNAMVNEMRSKQLTRICRLWQRKRFAKAFRSWERSCEDKKSDLISKQRKVAIMLKVIKSIVKDNMLACIVKWKDTVVSMVSIDRQKKLATRILQRFVNHHIDKSRSVAFRRWLYFSFQTKLAHDARFTTNPEQTILDIETKNEARVQADKFQRVIMHRMKKWIGSIVKMHFKS